MERTQPDDGTEDEQASDGDVPKELVDAAEQELEIPSDETNEG